MKILVFGAGVIGTTFAWQISEAGYDVSLLVRKQRLTRYSHSGVTVNCTDMRGKRKEFVKTVFRPKTVDRIDGSIHYDLIIVAVKNFQLNEVVPYIAKFSGNAHVLFMGNLWNEFGLIKKHLPEGRFFFGFPAMTGGGRTDNGINCLLFKKGNTMLGEPGGKTSQRLRDTAEILGMSGLQPKISSNIVHWIKAQSIWPAGTFGALCKSGSARKFSENNNLIRQSVQAIREGFKVCEAQGINPGRIFPFNLFFLPGFLLIPLLKRSYNPEMQEAVDGRMKHGFDEMKKQYLDVLNDGKSLDIDMPIWASFEKFIREAEKKRSDA
ncbi:MAG: 2-dehydropantoate 2-reductase N-terminal domain-containing protein [Bacteroidales bacterium]